MSLDLREEDTTRVCCPFNASSYSRKGQGISTLHLDVQCRKYKLDRGGKRLFRYEEFQKQVHLQHGCPKRFSASECLYSSDDACHLVRLPFKHGWGSTCLDKKKEKVRKSERNSRKRRAGFYSGGGKKNFFLLNGHMHSAPTEARCSITALTPSVGSSFAMQGKRWRYYH